MNGACITARTATPRTPVLLVAPGSLSDVPRLPFRTAPSRTNTPSNSGTCAGNGLSDRESAAELSFDAMVEENASVKMCFSPNAPDHARRHSWSAAFAAMYEAARYPRIPRTRAH
jgi:hypothetical protein